MDSVKFITEDGSLEKDMYADFGCILAHREIGAPTVKTEMISIPFRNGSINAYTLITPEPIYDNRIIKMNFLYLGANQNAVMAEIYQLTHGRVLNVEFSDDRGYWYKSNVTSVNNVKQKDKALYFTIECDCHPYKFDKISTLAEWDWDDLDLVNGIINDDGHLEINSKRQATFNLVCRKKKAYPTITTSGDLYFYLDDVHLGTLPAGSNKLYNVAFNEGINKIRLYNPGTDKVDVFIEYRGESL